MTAWTTPAFLLLGIAVGPQGLNLLSSSVLSLLDPGVAMGLAMLGVFVGLSFNPRQQGLVRLFAAAGARTATTVLAVGAAVLATFPFWQNSDSPLWLLSLMVGVCAAVSDTAGDVNVDDVLMIVTGGLIVAAICAPAASPMFPAMVAVAISILVAVAGWLLVGQTNSEGEQHVFVVGSLLLLGGAATSLSLSAVFAGLAAGLTWNQAGSLAKVRIVRDLDYFQHPLVVLVLVTAGAAAAVSIEAVAIALVFVAVRSVARPLGTWMSRRLSDAMSRAEERPSLISAGLIGISLALDLFRADGRPEWAVMLLAAIVIGSIVFNAIAVFVPTRGAVR
jgi:hypothetical protein